MTVRKHHQVKSNQVWLQVTHEMILDSHEKWIGMSWQVVLARTTYVYYSWVPRISHAGECVCVLIMIMTSCTLWWWRCIKTETGKAVKRCIEDWGMLYGPSGDLWEEMEWPRRRSGGGVTGDTVERRWWTIVLNHIILLCHKYASGT